MSLTLGDVDTMRAARRIQFQQVGDFVAVLTNRGLLAALTAPRRSTHTIRVEAVSGVEPTAPVHRLLYLGVKRSDPTWRALIDGARSGDRLGIRWADNGHSLVAVLVRDGIPVGEFDFSKRV